MLRKMTINRLAPYPGIPLPNNNPSIGPSPFVILRIPGLPLFKGNPGCLTINQQRFHSISHFPWLDLLFQNLAGFISKNDTAFPGEIVSIRSHLKDNESGKLYLFFHIHS